MSGSLDCLSPDFRDEVASSAFALDIFHPLEAYDSRLNVQFHAESLTMKTSITLASLAAVLLIAAAPNPKNTQPMLSHDVFFKLKDPSATARQTLVDACQKYLSDHPGTVWFSAGVLAPEFDRPVNDRDFDVALHVVFADKAAHDQYQTAPKHEQFIQEQRDNWESVRVFDSWVQSARPSAKPAPPRAATP
jgi:hypothetical protein